MHDRNLFGPQVSNEARGHGEAFGVQPRTEVGVARVRHHAGDEQLCGGLGDLLGLGCYRCSRHDHTFCLGHRRSVPAAVTTVHLKLGFKSTSGERSSP